MRLILTIYWLVIMGKSDAHFLPYTICAVLSAYASIKSPAANTGRKEKTILLILSVFYTLICTTANYAIFESFSIIEKYVHIFLTLISGFLVFQNLLGWLYELFQNSYNKQRLVTTKGKLVSFLIPFCLIVSIYLAYFWFVAYPGNLSVDSIRQIDQVQTGIYNNLHPFYHTQFITLCMDIGASLFGNINAAVATYSVVQIVLMSAFFSFAILTLYERGTSLRLLCLCTCVYAFLPYHWIYACTMWRDVLFSGMCLLMVTSFFRYRSKIGNLYINLILFFLSGIGVCIFRNNGLIVFAFFFAILCFYSIRTEKRISLVSFSVLALGLLLEGPVLSSLNIAQPDPVELLSVPLQQIARVIADKKSLVDYETQYVNSIMEIGSISNKYNPQFSDPIKNLARETGANHIISDDKIEFVQRWIKIGLRYPTEYFLAWIDQTKGYWNSGYFYWFAHNWYAPNPYGIVRQTKSNELNLFTEGLILRIGETDDFLSFLTSIGFFTWIYIMLFVFNLISGRKAFIELSPALGIIFSLLLGTPVFNEFRYAYGLFTMMPFVFIIATQGDRKTKPSTH